jgi:hypothetical protein
VASARTGPRCSRNGAPTGSPVTVDACTDPSARPATITGPAGPAAIVSAVTPSSWANGPANGAPVSASHSRTVASSPPETTTGRSSTTVSATAVTSSVCASMRTCGRCNCQDAQRALHGVHSPMRSASDLACAHRAARLRYDRYSSRGWTRNDGSARR